MDANKRNKLEWTDEVPATVGRQPEGDKAAGGEQEGDGAPWWTCGGWRRRSGIR